MKIRTTRKQALALNGATVAVGYCKLQSLLSFQDPMGVNYSNTYGWNYDVYDVYGVTICTGYNRMPGDAPKEIKAYEDKAQAVLNSDISDKDKMKEIDKLLRAFCAENGGFDYE